MPVPDAGAAATSTGSASCPLRRRSRSSGISTGPTTTFWNADHPARFPRFKKRSARLSIPLPGQAIRVTAGQSEVGLRTDTEARRGQVPAVPGSRGRSPERDGYARMPPGAGASASPCARAIRQPLPTNCRRSASTSGSSSLPILSDEALPRLMPPSLTDGERRRLEGLERRKARQIRHARRHRGGAHGARLRRTLREIARIKARQARRRLDFTHKLTTDLAKNHGLVADRGPAGEGHDEESRGRRGCSPVPRLAQSGPQSRHPRQPSGGRGDVSSPTSARGTGRCWSPSKPPVPRRRAGSAATGTRRSRDRPGQLSLRKVRARGRRRPQRRRRDAPPRSAASADASRSAAGYLR